jgi:hypothetical protein
LFRLGLRVGDIVASGLSISLASLLAPGSPGQVHGTESREHSA